jgi:hypothetical protein
MLPGHSCMLPGHSCMLPGHSCKLQKCCKNVAKMLQKCIRGYKNIAKMHPQPSIVAKILQKCIRCCKRSKMRPHNKVRDASARVTIRSRKTMQVRPRNQCERLSARATIRSRSLCVSDDTIEENLAGGTTYPKLNDRGNPGPIMLLIMLLDPVA